VGVARAAALALLAVSASVRAEDVLHLPIGDPARRDCEAPVVLDAITDTATGALWTPAELPQRLAGAGLVLVGEGHTDADSHRVEKRVLEELVRSGRRVTIGLEMYPYTAQAWLDDWCAGNLSEQAFLDGSRWYLHWGYNWLYYREIFLFARDHRIPMLAINAPREVVAAVRRKGFRGLTSEEAAHVPTDVDSKNAEYMRLFRAEFAEGSFHAGMDEAAWQSMLDAQCTWDATMGLHAVRPLASGDDPQAIVVVLVGAGHVQYGLGIERQVRRSFPGNVASVIPVAVEDARTGPVRTVQASYANFVWGTPAEAEPTYPDLGVSTNVRARDGLLEVFHVEDDSPAARGGIAYGDVLLSLDGVPVSTRESLARAMAGKRWGDDAVFSVAREGVTVEVTVPLRRTGLPPR
jgi:aminopeptidase N